MSQAESLSDSDSNTSSSWIFVDDCPSDSQQEKNKYYLNCDSEPVQELTSQYLNSTNPEPETDSDGISIISESDDTKESSPHQEPKRHLVEDIRAVDDVTPTEGAPKIVIVNTEEYYLNKYAIVGWVLLAVAIPILVNFFSNRIEEILVNYNGNTALTAGNVQPEILTNKDLYRRNKGAVQNPVNELMQKQNGDSSERKKRYDSKGEIDEHRLDRRDHVSVMSNFNRRTKERNNKKEGKFSEEHSLMNPKSQKPTFKQMEKKKHRTANINPKKKKEDFNTDISMKKKDAFGKHQKKKKIMKGQEKEGENSYNNYAKEIKKLRKKLEGKDKDIKGLIKLIKAKDRQLKMLEYKILKHLNSLTKSEKGKNDADFHDKSNSTDGEWYQKLNKGRNSIRKQQRVADWVFDRADGRSKKRNFRNNWYWNWMADREHLRLKRGFRQFTY